MKENLDYIIFAVKQAKEAEKFGFTRNHCCRNLKMALQQYWQNKTLRQHPQIHRTEIPRSKEAVGRDLRECNVEHVVPQMLIVNWLMDMPPLTKDKVGALLKKYFRVLLITKDEHARLNASGLRSKMPENWDEEDVWARYRAVGIESTRK